MGALLGSLLGVGLLLVWRAPGARSETHTRPSWLVRRWAARRTELLRRAGVPEMTSGQLLGLQLAVGCLGGALVLAATGSISVAVCFGLFGLAVPVRMVRRLQRNRAVDLREVWPDAVDNLASAVRAGLALPEAVAGLGERGPEPLRTAFRAFGADYRATGRFLECLDRLKQTLADPVGDRVCETLRVAREVGGSDLGSVLRTLSAFLREDARVRNELETRQTWTVNAARLAVTAPWMILLLLATQATSLEAYDSSGGATLLAIGALTCGIAYQLMLRIGRLPDEPRVLA